jgi:hypothetical protein
MLATAWEATSVAGLDGPLRTGLWIGARRLVEKVSSDFV